MPLKLDLNNKYRILNLSIDNTSPIGINCVLCCQVCSALREELDEQHKKRLESFEMKMKPIIIRDGPSQKVL